MSAKETVEKIEKPKDEPKPKVSMFELYRYATFGDYLLILVGFISAAANGATLPVMTIFFGDIIQALVIYDGSPAARIAVDNSVSDGVIKMCLVGLATVVFSYIQMCAFVLSGERQTKKIREKYFNAILRQDVAWFDKVSTGDLTNRLTADMTLIQEGMSDKVGLMIQFTCAFLSGFVIGYVRGWRLALVLTGTLPFLAGCAMYLAKLLASGTEEEQKAYAGAGDVAQQVISSIRTVVAFGGEDKEIKRYTDQLDEAERVGLKKALINGAGVGSIQLLVFLVYALAFGYGNTLVPGVMSTGEVLNVIFAIIIGAFSLGNATPHISAIGTAQGTAVHIFETIDRQSPIDPLSEVGEIPEKVVGNIEFSDIEFFYPSRPDVQVLKKFNLNVEAGKTVALVGSSGSGKSTMVKLLERFYDPSAGLVKLDGKDIKQLNVKWLRQQIGMVSQEPALFDTTIKHNISLGLPDYEKMPESELDKLIEQACVEANCWEFIQKLPLKLDTKVGEGSILLSGGQKQRIAIARAIIKNPPILLLDEATSALDTQSERIVQDALEKASQDRTTIVIAHRLSTVKNADLIVVMAKGDIIEQGVHGSLIEKGGLYANLVKTQSLKTREDGQAVSEEVTDISSTSNGTAHLVRKNSGVIVMKVDDGAEKKVSGTDYKVDYQRLFSWNKPELHLWFLGAIGAAINGASQPLFALLFAEVLTALGTPRAYTYAYIFIGLAFGAFLANFLQVGLFKYAGEKMTRRVREACFRALLKQEIGFFDRDENATGALTAKLAEDASLLQGLTGQTFGAVIQGAAGIITGLVLAFIASWQLSLVILGLVPVITLAGFLQMQALVGYGDKTRVAYENSSKKASEAILNIRTIITITQESTFYKNYADSILIPHSMTVQSAFVSSGGFAFSQSILHFAWATALYYGAQLMKWGLYSGGDIMEAMFAIIFTAMAAGQVSNYTPDAAKAKLAAASVFGILDRVSEIDVTKSVGEQRPAAEGNSALEKVEFSYPARPDTKILKGLNLKADKGMTVALVGKSGCGKSTVMGLVLRWYDPSAGLVTFDGLNEKDWDLRTLRSFIAIVGQEPVLFNISVRENIAYGALSPPDDLAIHEAAKLANIHDFIMSLPTGYDTMVGEKGGKLSGGQKQRLAIARALIRNPRLLLLDEATSALDSESEHVVQEALDVAAKGRTTIVIAHRLSTIQHADMILVVDNGEIAESGTHFELIDKKGIYNELVNQQKLK